MPASRLSAVSVMAKLGEEITPNRLRKLALNYHLLGGEAVVVVE